MSAQRLLRLFLFPCITANWSSVGFRDTNDAAPNKARAAKGAIKAANGDSPPPSSLPYPPPLLPKKVKLDVKTSYLSYHSIHSNYMVFLK